MLAERALAPLTDVFLFESAYIAGRFDAFVGAANGVRRIVANGIGAAEFAPVAPNADAADLLYVGELRAAKGIDTLLEAIALRRPLARPRPARGARRLGPGPGRADRSWRKRLGVAPFVSFPGPMPVREAFRLGRMLVVPSRAESMPYVVLEAAGARVPMIATNVGGIPEIYGPFRDRLGPPDDPADLHARIEATLAVPADRRQRRGRRSRRLRRRALLDPDHGEFRDGGLRARRSRAAAARSRPATPRRDDSPSHQLRPTMAAFSAVRHRKRSPRRPRSGTAASRANADAAATGSPPNRPAPAYSRVVIAGVVRAIESALIVLTGMAIYFALRRAQRRPAAGLLLAVIVGVAAMSIVSFSRCNVYSAPAFRHPVRAAVPHRRRLDAGVSRRLRRDVLPQARWRRVARLDGRLVRSSASPRSRSSARSCRASIGQLWRAPGACSSAPSSSAAARSARELLRELAKSDEAEVQHARRLRRSRRRALARHGRGLSQARQRRRSRRIRALDAHRSRDLRAADHRRAAHPADAAQALGAADRHSPRRARQPAALPAALLFLCRPGAGARSLRQADRRLGRRHQAGVRQDRRRARARSRCRRCWR